MKKALRRLITAPAWMEMVLYTGISVYILFLFKWDVGVLTAIVPKQWQVGWYAFPIMLGEFWIFLSAGMWACFGTIGIAFELIGSFIDPHDEDEEREARDMARWCILWFSPLGGVAVVIGCYAVVCVGIPYGVARHVFQSFQPVVA